MSTIQYRGGWNDKFGLGNYNNIVNFINLIVENDVDDMRYLNKTPCYRVSEEQNY